MPEGRLMARTKDNRSSLADWSESNTARMQALERTLPGWGRGGTRVLLLQSGAAAQLRSGRPPVRTAEISSRRFQQGAWVPAGDTLQQSEFQWQRTSRQSGIAQQTNARTVDRSSILARRDKNGPRQHFAAEWNCEGGPMGSEPLEGSAALGTLRIRVPRTAQNGNG